MTQLNNINNETRPSTGRVFVWPRGQQPHDARTCHKCMAGKLDHYEMSDAERRSLCNALAAQGFDLDYLAHRYGLTYRPEQLKRAPDDDE